MKKLSFDDDELLPKVSCTSTDCEKDLHCFRPKKMNPHKLVGGPCFECKADLIDWKRMHEKNIDDADQYIAFLKKENIRNHFWTLEIPAQKRHKFMLKGKLNLDLNIMSLLKHSVQKCPDKIFRDGTQTSTTKWDIIKFAQHATATCCRKCIKYWHDIPYDRELTEDELEYFRKLIMKYIDYKLPNFPDDKNMQWEINF